MRIVYGCCVGSWDKYERYIAPQVYDRTIFTSFGQASIAVAYNTLLEEFAKFKVLDALILLHDDLEIIDSYIEKKFFDVLSEPDVALAGVAGGGKSQGYSWWLDNPIGHQNTDAQMIDFGKREGDVDILEGSILAFSPWAVKNLRFDTQFQGFHGYDEIALQAQAAGKRNVVVDVDTHHHTQMGFKSKESQRIWEHNGELLKQKWNL